MKTDGLTIIGSSDIVKKEKGKSLDEMTLPERADLLKEANNLLDGAEDITDEEMEIVSRLSNSVDEKVASWGLVIRKVEDAIGICKAEEAYYKEKAAAAKARADSFYKKAENMNGFLKRKMLELNKKKVETPLFTVSLNKKRQSVEILPDANLEDPENASFVDTVVSKQWKKTAIKEALDSGKELKHFKMSEPDFTVKIK